jgi:hypothetical protein
MSGGASRKVLLLEFNEITWTIINPLIASGKLPNLARLRREGTFASPEATENRPHLDPWVTWVTLHTGVERSVHGATVLEQDSSMIRAKRTWDYAIEAGKSVGVFGSISAYPPRPVRGFIVPGPFAPGPETFPQFLQPVQDLNRRYTQVHNNIVPPDTLLEMARKGVQLFKLGLRRQTAARIALQLAREKVEPHLAWKRVALQPLINYDFFESLYRRYCPDFATWHTNHAAHYMHRYWRAMDDRPFSVAASQDEKKKYGGAIEYGYELCDELLGRFMKLCGDDTVLVVASSMGQEPYRHHGYTAGKIPVRIRDMRRLLALIGAEGVTEVNPMLLPQWNLCIPNAAKRAIVCKRLQAATCVGGVHPRAMDVIETGDILTLSPRAIAKQGGEVRYFFPGVPKASPKGYPLGDLFVADLPTANESMYHPTGVLGFWGKGVRAGVEINDTTNLDIAPTLLALLGVPVPSVMKGRVLAEVWQGAAQGGAHSSVLLP